MAAASSSAEWAADESNVEEEVGGGDLLCDEDDGGAAADNCGQKEEPKPAPGAVQQKSTPSDEAPGAPSLLDQINSLRLQQKAQRVERQKVTAQLKNAKRRRSRLKSKARLLSDVDLAQVIAIRAENAAIYGKKDATGSEEKGPKASASASSSDAAKQPSAKVQKV